MYITCCLTDFAIFPIMFTVVQFWEEQASKVTDKLVDIETTSLGESLKFELGLTMGEPYSADQSKLFKSLYTNPPRMKNTFIVEK
jgi:hypothetical protein